MSKFIAAKILKTDSKNVINHPKGRNLIGMIASTTSVIFNTLLGISKVAIGIIFHSISILSDGINNVTDTASSAVSLVGFKLAGKPADKDHPFGHARAEYITAMIISMIITVLGIELFISSVERIISKEVSEFSYISIGILCASILIKICLYIYNLKYSKIIDSSTLKGVAIDCINDVITTFVVLISTIISQFTGFNADGYAGIIVALFIAVQGIRLLISTCSPLLGEKPNKDLVSDLVSKIRSYDGVLGIHDLIVHNYGPNKYFVTIHVEVDSNVDINVSHELIDNIERELSTPDLHLVIHLDPLNMSDHEIEYYRTCTLDKIREIDDRFTIHDFRMVTSPNLIRLLFDIVVPADFVAPADLAEMIDYKVKEIDYRCEAVFNIDIDYVDFLGDKSNQS